MYKDKKIKLVNGALVICLSFLLVLTIILFINANSEKNAFEKEREERRVSQELDVALVAELAMSDMLLCQNKVLLKMVKENNSQSIMEYVTQLQIHCWQSIKDDESLEIIFHKERQ